jgi:hypothetical protein
MAFAINARSTPKPGVSTAHAHKKSPTATGATTCEKRHPVQRRPTQHQPWCTWVNDPLEPEQLPPDWKPPPPPPHQLDDEPPF